MGIFPGGRGALQRGFNYFSKAILAIAPLLILWSLSFSFFEGGNEWGENSLYFIPAPSLSLIFASHIPLTK